MDSKGFVIIVGELGSGEFPSELPVIAAGSVQVIDCPECAVIVTDGAEIPTIRRAAGVMINGDNGGSFPAERLSGVQLITCGRCGKNTVSITSDSGDSVTLALNRAVTTLNGICEPMEYPVKRRNDTPEYLLMAEFAAAVLLGMIGE